MAQTKVTMSLLGMDALKQAIKRSPEVLRAHAATATGVSAFAIHQRMRARVPVDTGGLRLALEYSQRGLSGRVHINPGAFYWRYIEFGTVRMAARPFIRPAAEEESNTFLQRMRAIGPKLERDWSTGRYA